MSVINLDLPVFLVFGAKSSPPILVKAWDGDTALCFARRRDRTYCGLQMYDFENKHLCEPISEDTELVGCFYSCNKCRELSQHFTKSTCALDFFFKGGKDGDSEK